ncbi:MAG: 50S ribosomal protein L25 [Gemmatimonadales bacterium]|nr:50S ribosomal protein L25 [Gemmatimonadales bacterium]
MDEVTLAAESRTMTGKGAARSLRREGKVPAVIYGHGRDPIALSLDARSLGRLLDRIGGETALIDVAVDGAAPVKALVREVQRNPVRRVDVIHLDLYAVVAGEPITVEVAVHVVGTADGVRNHGGVLEHILHRLSVRVLPGDIPEHIDVDVSHLAVGDSVHVSELSVPKCEILNDGELSVVTVVAPRVEVEPVVEEDASAEPEVIKKGKGEEAETAGE